MINLTNKEYTDLIILLSEVRQYTKNHDVNEYNDMDRVNQMARLRLRKYSEHILDNLEKGNNNLHKIITD